MTVRDTDDARIAALRNTLEIISRKVEDLSGDLADGVAPFAIAQRLRIIGDLCAIVLKRDAEMGGFK